MGPVYRMAVTPETDLAVAADKSAAAEFHHTGTNAGGGPSTAA